MPASYIDFTEERLLIGIDYGVVGGAEFKTEILSEGSGREQRNALWWQPLGRWQLGERSLLDSDYDSIAEVQYLRDFHSARKGSLQGFRFKDWSDYRGTFVQIGIGDGSNKQFQLVKVYRAGNHSFIRPILKPVADTTSIYLDGSPITIFTVDTSRGIVELDVPPAEGRVITADFEFDIPVQFEADKIEWILDAIQLQDGSTLHKLGSVMVKEMRINLDTQEYNFDPIPQTIEQPLDLGVILDTSETITFDTRVESTVSGYSSRQSYGNQKVVFKLPTFRFNQQQLNTILDYFWVAKGRLVTFPLVLNNRTETVRFNSDSLSIKFIATDTLRDSLYEVSLEFLTPNLLFFDKETYVKAIIDASGSMNLYTAPVVEAVNNLKEFLSVNIYGDEETTNKYFKPITYFSNEEWLNWTNEDLRDDPEEPNKQVFLIWINEASPVYHNTNSSAMTTTFESHLNTFLANYEEREKFRAFIYSVNPDGTPGGLKGFETHLIEADGGLNNYPVALRNYGFIARPGINPEVNAEFYFNDIINS